MTLTVLIAILGSSAITGALLGLRCAMWAAAMVGALTPAATIFAYFAYLEANAPVGPYFIFVGLAYGAVALVVGAIFAVVTAILTGSATS